MTLDGLYTGAEVLETLKSDLQNLSKSLHEVYSLMNADLSQLGETWRDGKYEEYVSGYKPQINKCEEIANRYETWCSKVLDPAIDKAKEIEKVSVGGDDGAGGGSMGGNASPSKKEAFEKGIQKVQEMGKKPTLEQLLKAKKDADSGPDSSSRNIGHNAPQMSPSELRGLFYGRGGRER